MKGTFLFVMLVLWGLSMNGQSLNELRNKKDKTAQAIKYTSNLLEEARKDEKASVGKVRLINSQIKNRNNLIENISSEINVLDYYIGENSTFIEMIREDLDKLKLEYAGMIRFAQKNKNTYDKLIFLFSSENINQAYKRMIYLQQYAGYRKNQASLMISLADLLDKKVASLSLKKDEKTQLVNQKASENQKLLAEKNQQDKYISSLQKRQRDLKKKLRDQQKEQEKLNDEIERLLAEEARKAKEKGGGFELTPEQKLIAADFEKNKGRLPWPVDRGVITEQFGVHAHPVLKQVQVKNNGIDITTTKNTKARAVFNGEVSRVFTISGGNVAVIIRHGSFLSVYSNLQEVYVKPGDQVKTKQEIGLIYSDQSDGKTVLKFQVWKENEKQNPEFWISR